MRDLNVDPIWIGSMDEKLRTYHDILATDGVERGLIGPREVPRLWSRHLRNCVAVADPSLGLVPLNSAVVDVGAGAGLPGIVWAIARPDLSVTLVEPLQRRSIFLQEAIRLTGVGDRVDVVTGRSQDIDPLDAEVVTSRALAPLPTVVEWSLPHLRVGGRMLAIKGGKAEAELEAARASIARCGGQGGEVIRIGPIGTDGHPMATVVSVRSGRPGGVQRGN